MEKVFGIYMEDCGGQISSPSPTLSAQLLVLMPVCDPTLKCRQDLQFTSDQ